MSTDSTKPGIEIPRADDNEVVTVPHGTLGDIKKRFEKIDQILFGIMIVVVLSLVAIIVSVIGLFIDQMRFNNAAYKEYSDNTEILNSLIKTDYKLNDQYLMNQTEIIDKLNDIRTSLNNTE